MTIRQTCIYVLMASGVLLLTGGPVLAEQSKSGTHAQSGKGDTSRNADGLTEGVKPSGKPKTAPEATKSDASKANPDKGSAGGSDLRTGSGSGSTGSSGNTGSSGSGY
ncbi:MAG: hypothetical protein QM706_06220 [Nitrospira sp.]